MKGTIKVQLIPDNKETYDYIYPLLNETYKIYNRSYYYMMLFYDKKTLESLDMEVTSKDVYKRVTSEFPNFPNGLISNIIHSVEQDFSTDMKKGMVFGRCQPRTYRSGAAVITQFRNNNKNPLNNRPNPSISKRDDDYVIKLSNELIFKMILGYGKNKFAERNRLIGLINRALDVTDPLRFDTVFKILRKGTKLYLLLTFTTPESTYIPDPNKVLGIDVGVRRLITGSIQDDPWNRLFIHNTEFVNKKIYFEKKLRELRRSLHFVSGGHGRQKKLRALDRYTEVERNFTESMCHLISADIIKFCKNNNVGIINMEFLHRQNTDDDIKKEEIFFIRYWPISNLMGKIQYKAEREGIVVKFVDPYHTSQECSCCGEVGIRDKENFTCTNPDCSELGKTIDSDLNASRNIAKSTKYVDKYEDTTYFKKYKNTKEVEEVL